ncbi:MAG: preprotein translocase subunit SecG [Candidatus Poribacteria bacterium]|nr:preprotein translocase subunit SecG [Candidatus Poribacteria bacterium]
MGIFVTIALIIFVPVCIILTLIILLQDSKGEGLSSSAFGGAEMQSILGGHGAATFLSKLTTWVAVGFMVISLFLMRFYGETGSSNLTPLEDESEQAQEATGQDTAEKLETDTSDDDPKGTIKTTQEPSEDTNEETPTDDPKGTE